MNRVLAACKNDDLSTEDLVKMLGNNGGATPGRLMVLDWLKCLASSLREFSRDGQLSGLVSPMVCYINLTGVVFEQRPNDALKMLAEISCEGVNIIKVKRSATDRYVLDMGRECLNMTLPNGLASLALVKLCEAHSHLANSVCPNSVAAPKSNSPVDCAAIIRATCKVVGDPEQMVNGMLLDSWIGLIVTVAEMDLVNLLTQCWQIVVLTTDENGQVWISKNGRRRPGSSIGTMRSRR